MRACLLLSVLASLLVTGSAYKAALSRRSALQNAGLAAIGAHPLVAHAAMKGEEEFPQQYFGSNVCKDRTLLGACKEQSAAVKAGSPGGPAYTVLQAPVEEQSELVKRLLEKTEQNAEANNQLVKEKTIYAGLSGQYGILAKTTPVMRADGSFSDLSFARFDKLKGRGVIVKTKTGLDAFTAGFDPDAPEPQREKMFGLF